MDKVQVTIILRETQEKRPAIRAVKQTCGACEGVGRIVPLYDRAGASRLCTLCKGTGVLKFPIPQG